MIKKSIFIVLSLGLLNCSTVDPHSKSLSGKKCRLVRDKKDDHHTYFKSQKPCLIEVVDFGGISYNEPEAGGEQPGIHIWKKVEKSFYPINKDLFTKFSSKTGHRYLLKVNIVRSIPTWGLQDSSPTSSFEVVEVLKQSKIHCNSRETCFVKLAE